MKMKIATKTAKSGSSEKSGISPVMKPLLIYHMVIPSAIRDCNMLRLTASEWLRPGSLLATMAGCPVVDSLPEGSSAPRSAELWRARVLWVGCGSGGLTGGVRSVGSGGGGWRG